MHAAGRLTTAAPPLVPEGQTVPVGTVANALPQALVLTAIVIGFGLLAFALSLVFRGYQAMGTLDSDRRYVLCCDTGRRSSAGAYILSERGYKAYVLRGGISSSQA